MPRRAGARVTKPYELPAFYLPCPARLNANADGARRHTSAWSRRMGILEPGPDAGAPEIWTEADLDAHNYPLLRAYTHPDCPADELNLITDWYVWVFYFDDHFLEVYKRPRNLDGGKPYLEPLPSYMPLDLEAPLPAPTNPAELLLPTLRFPPLPSTSPP